MRPTRRLLGMPYLASIRTIGFSTQRFPDYRNPSADYHQHDVVELFYVLDGEGTHALESGERPLQRGDLGIVNFGQVHSIVSDEPMDIINIYINPARYALPALSVPLSGILPRILPLAPGLGHRLNRVQQFSLPESSTVGDILLSINNEAVEKQPGYLDAMKNYLRLFLIECARQALEDQGQDAARISGPQASVERTRRYLDENWREEIDLNKLAERARMSKPHLCRIFRRYTGKTIIEYLHQRRIEQAMIMLDSTSEKVITIASEAGFGDLAHFNRIFRRITGKTPTSFRKRSEQQCGDMAAEAEADVSLSVTTKSDGAADR